jgi:ribosomal protein L29
MKEKTKNKAILAMSKEEMENKIAEAELELMKLHGQAATGTPPQKTAQIKNLKRSIARFKTLMQK